MEVENIKLYNYFTLNIYKCFTLNNKCYINTLFNTFVLK